MTAQAYGPGLNAETLVDILEAVAKEAKQDSSISILQSILLAVDDLELTADNIDIDLDDVEALLSALQSSNEAHSDELGVKLDDVEALLSALQSSNEAHSDELGVKLDAIDTELQTQQKDALTDTELRASDLEIRDDELHSLVGEVSATPTANTILARLKDIYESVDGLELSVDNIDIDLDDVNLNLDDVETILSSIETLISGTDFGTEATLEKIRLGILSLGGLGAEQDLSLPQGGEITVTDTPTFLLGYNDSRSAFTVQNLGNSPCRLGPSSVTQASGFVEMDYKDFFIWDNSSLVTKEPLYAICPSGENTILLVAEHVNLDDTDASLLLVNGDNLTVNGDFFEIISTDIVIDEGSGDILLVNGDTLIVNGNTLEVN